MRAGTVTNTTAHWRCALLNTGAILAAFYVVIREGWDLDADGLLCLKELALVLVRLLAFPVHVLLQVTPAPVLALFGLPDAPWPPSALLAVALSLPLWGIFVIGGLMLEAWLELAAEASPPGGEDRRGPIRGMPRV
ncbi:hypothetical protein [Belnapia rosea]|uniref:hypothetical protein n=1 Tax=Belnapia rosea TaxID=938405 RepID=UPI00088557C0|nr:hypothetical protein [Belnapia rosea]SDB52852.1 hypothetical protein SAMN02927895_01959 [Belnapia rosea]